MLRPLGFTYLPRRWKSKKIHWAELQKKKFAKDRALENFDDFYGSVFGHKWKSMRVALLTEHKYVALINNFADVNETASKLEVNGAINVNSLLNIASKRLLMENKETLREDNIYKLDQSLENIIREQEAKEHSSLYPPQSDLQVENSKPLFFEEELDQGGEKGDETVSYKKSLEKALEEDIELDERRIIDTEYGTGALYEFIPATKIKGMEDWIPESEHYKYYKTNTDFPISIELEKQLSFPENLHLYTYEKGNCSQFPSPKKASTGVLSHFLLDGASILPPLMLDINGGEKVLDVCAAPGGKSLLMLQTLHPDVLVCNDIQESRVNRIKRIMGQYVCDYKTKWDGKRCFITQSDARNIDDFESYDKILVDVPCTTDRHALMENDNNIFKPTRVKERLRIPELQSAILINSLRLLKPGGSLVYSTCSLSPIQNDGVVHMSLQKAFTEFGITATIKDLSFIVQYFKEIFKFENSKSLKYGQMVIPFLPANFGPLYFSKITRNV